MPHLHDKIDFTIAAYIVYRDSVLLIDHKQLKKWLPIGGHIELDEDPEEALFREIEEESGLTRDHLLIFGNKPEIESFGTKFLYSPTFLDIHDISSTHKHVGMVYLLKSDTNVIKRAEKEHNEIKWVKGENMDDEEYNLLPAVKYYSMKALQAF